LLSAIGTQPFARGLLRFEQPEISHPRFFLRHFAKPAAESDLVRLENNGDADSIRAQLLENLSRFARA
jgi:hypothetical protein